MDINALPDASLKRSFSYLLPRSLCVCAQVSRRWNDLAKSNDLWRPFTKYITEPPKGAWVTQDKDDDVNEKEQKWDGSNALQWLRKAHTTKTEGGISYEIKGKTLPKLKDSVPSERNEKEFFKKYAGRGWHLPQFKLKTDSSKVRIKLESGTDLKKVVVDGKDTFSFGDVSATNEFWFQRTSGTPAIDFEGQLPQEIIAQLASGQIEITEQLINQLGAALPSLEYDVTFIKIYPQDITVASSTDFGYSFGDVWKNEFAKWWGKSDKVAGQKYYRCWNNATIVNLGQQSQMTGTEPGPDSLLTVFAIPIVEDAALDKAKLEEIKQSWKQNDKDLCLPIVTSVGFWDNREISESFEKQQQQQRSVSQSGSGSNLSGTATPFISNVSPNDQIGGDDGDIIIDENGIDVSYLHQQQQLSNTVISRVDYSTHLVNFILDGHYRIKAAAELNLPIGLLSFVERPKPPPSVNNQSNKNVKDKKKNFGRGSNEKLERDEINNNNNNSGSGSSYKSIIRKKSDGGVYFSSDQVFLKLTKTCPFQKLPSQSPLSVVTRIPIQSPLIIRLGYAHSYASSREIFDQMRKDGVRPQKIIVGPQAADYEVIAVLHDNDFKTMKKVFADNSTAEERSSIWRYLSESFQLLDLRIPINEDLDRINSWKDVDTFSDEKHAYPRRGRKQRRGGAPRRGGSGRGDDRNGGGRGRGRGRGSFDWNATTSV